MKNDLEVIAPDYCKTCKTCGSVNTWKCTDMFENYKIGDETNYAYIFTCSCGEEQRIDIDESPEFVKDGE